MQNNSDPTQFRLKDSIVALIKGNKKLQLHLAILSNVGQASIKLWLKDNDVSLTTYENLTLISKTTGIVLYDLIQIHDQVQEKKNEPVMA